MTSDHRLLDCVSDSFSPFHELLMDIAIGEVKPRVEDIVVGLGEPLSRADLHSLGLMVQLEFAASIKKEIENTDEAQVNDPHPFDVFLMEQALDRPGVKFAVCIPMKRSAGKENCFMWYDGRGNLFDRKGILYDEKGSLWPLDPPIHVRRVASLSGAARILESLAELPSPGSLMDFAMNREMLIDVIDYEEGMVNPSFVASMNESQKQAVATVASPSFRYGLLAIHGPPGCGKTTTMIGMISVIGRGMIVAAPSNAAVANIALKLEATKRFDLRDICVFGENCDESVHFLNPRYRSKKYKEFMNTFLDLQDDEARERELKSFAAWLHLDIDPASISLAYLAQICPDVDPDTRGGRSAFTLVLHSASVVLCTLNSSGSKLLRHAVGTSFHTYLLDEGGQCPEAEFFIATTFPGIKRIIVVGDPKQLPATVIERACQKAGYDNSWLGRVFEVRPDKIHLLNTQYRMAKDILAFPNAHFYENRIMSGDNVDGRQPYVEYAFRFVDTIKRGREEKNQHSWQNVYEVFVIKSILCTDEDIIRLRKESDGSLKTMIIAPYKAQVKLLKEHLGSLKGLGSLEVSTYDSVQGQESDVLIISTVRTRHVGFTDDAQRLNVALTRAKRVLRVVGDLSFLLGLKHGSVLRALANHAEKTQMVDSSKLKAVVWSPPDWDQQTLWKPTMTAEFHHCLRGKDDRDTNVLLQHVTCHCQAR